MTHDETLGAERVTAAPGLGDWRMLQHALHSRFRTSSFAQGAQFVTAIAQEAEELNHHPDVELRYGAVWVRTASHDAGGLTDRDLRLARRISARAADLGIDAEPLAVSAQEIAIDTLDRAVILPFWRAVLGYREERVGYDRTPASGGQSTPDAVVDPDGRHPLVWFQQMNTPRPQRNRVHMDVWVPADAAQQRVREAVAAGGTVVSAAHAPAFWVLADAEGNEACVCTVLGRESRSDRVNI